MKRLIQILLIVNCSLLTLPREIKYKLCIFLFFILFYLTGSNCYSQWVQQTVPVSKPIQGIKFIDTLKGWACTGNSGSPNEGYVLHTTNGGTNWFVQLTVPATSLNAICVIDSNIIYAGGSNGNGQLYKTTNGGTNWISLGAPSIITDMVFMNKDSGYYCSDLIGADVRTTTNGGLNWTVRISGIASQTQRIFFLNYNTGYCGASGFLYETTNAGISWILNHTFSPPQINSIYFINQNTGWIGINTVHYTSNGGVNWIMQTLPPEGNGNVYDLIFLNNLTGYAGTGLFRIFKTTDGGSNWGYQIDPGGSYRIAVTDSMNAWACWIGTTIGITHTSNGGGQIIYTGLVNNGNTIPVKFLLYQNYPNPFNPMTTIKLDMPKPSSISLAICDMLGRELYTIANEYLKAGSYNFTWDAANYSSGIYFYRLTTNSYTETKKMILIK